MNLAIGSLRICFLLIAVLFFMVYGVSFGGDLSPLSALIAGSGFAILMIAIESFFKSFRLKEFNLAILGLLFGAFMGQAVLFGLDILLLNLPKTFNPETLTLFKVLAFLTSIYFGMVLSLKASESFYLSIPFVRLIPQGDRDKDLLLDLSILLDPRLVDLAHSGLIDRKVVVPSFIVKYLEAQAESSEESTKHKAKKALEALKKIENFAGLNLRYNETDFPDIKDVQGKLAKLAKQLHANVLTAELNKIQQAEMDGVKLVNINFLSQALKPLTTTGEIISIKIQRYGKEPRQGVGYLDDGTMVVVNGGAEFIGDTIKAIVLSVKHTTSGRMIFCNAGESLPSHEDVDHAGPRDLESTLRHYL